MGKECVLPQGVMFLCSGNIALVSRGASDKKRKKIHKRKAN